MQFVWAHYPLYSQTPHMILDWLIGEARRIAIEEQQARFLYAGPQNQRNNYYNQNYEEEEEDYD
jgi:hypothetical protein